MRITKQQSGFAAFELILAVLLVAIIVVAGWWVYQNRESNTTADTTTATTTQSPVAHNVSTAPAINTTDDLDKALNTLNQNDPSASNSADSNLLSSQSNF